MKLDSTYVDVAVPINKFSLGRYVQNAAKNLVKLDKSIIEIKIIAHKRLLVMIKESKK